jgi:hypothetical protein
MLRRIPGINPGVVRLRKPAGTTAVKSPDRMRDVAQIRCDQAGVINVDGSLRGLGAFGYQNFDGVSSAQGQESPAL